MEHDNSFAATSIFARERRYLSWLQAVLSDEVAFDVFQRRLARQTKVFAKEHRSALACSPRLAWAVLAKAVVFTVGPIVTAWRLVLLGWWPLVLPFVVIAGLALFGLTSVIHDAVHVTFFRSRWANRLLGEVLSPVFGFDFMTFRRSHMAHHRDNQSLEHDPKYPKVPWPTGVLEAEESKRRGGTRLRGVMLLVRGWFALARRVQASPRKVRVPFYVGTVVLFGGPVALGFGGEISLMGRDWRSTGPWRSLATTLVFYAGLFALSPILFGLVFAAVWFALGCFFMVFLTHLSPAQVYMRGRNDAVRFFALNVSDLRLGFWMDMLGNRFVEYHSAHHMFPFVPSYRLEIAGQWLDREFGPWKAPVLRIFDPEHCAYLGDGVIDSLTKPRDVLWPKWTTPHGEYLHRESVKRAA